MQIEHGLIADKPGLEESYTIIPDTMRMNPRCPCLTPGHARIMAFASTVKSTTPIST